MLNTSQRIYRIPIDHDNTYRGRQTDYSTSFVLPAHSNSVVLEVKGEYRYASSSFDRGNQPQIRELRHILSNGVTAWKQVFNIKMERPLMFRDDQLMFYDAYRAEFTFVSLTDYTISTVKRPKAAEGAVLDVFVFGETGLLALTFRYRNILEVRYYDAEGFRRGEDSLQTVKITLETMRYEQVYKVNNRSMIGWPRTDAFYVYSSHRLMFDLISFHRTTGVHHEVVSTVNDVNSCLGLHSSQTHPLNWIESISEASPDRYLITIPRPSMAEEGLEHAEVFVVNAEDGLDRAVLSVPEAVRHLKSLTIAGNWMLHSESLWYGVAHERYAGEEEGYFEGQEYFEENGYGGEGYSEKVYCGIHIAHMSSPRVYFSLESQPHYRESVQRADWDDDTLFIVREMIVWSGSRRELVVQVATLRSLKDACMQMLLHLEEDFDDDLLQDAVEMITE